MIACILCLEEKNSVAEKQIDVYSQDNELDVCTIISKHFWLRPNCELCPGQKVCWSCWEMVRDFHYFYQRVADAHKRFERKSPFILVNSGDDDPLPQGLKSEELNSAGKLVEALGEHFFDSEVKVEVHDLEFLPQIEIIEDNVNVSQRALRANRRSRAGRGRSASRSPTAFKRIKCENSTINTPDNESETELPLSVLMTESEFKTDFNETLAQESEPNEKLLPKDKKDDAAQPQKKRRGRPKKIKEEIIEQKTDTQPEPRVDDTLTIANADEMIVKSDDENENALAGLDSGTEDSADSSSDNSDSDYSLPDAEPPECYAEIPKRVVVKPKKYRKRPKPVVPPRRMTREEIDRKNAQQVEYDKVIAKFFGKYSCPKCSLLVQNFGQMRIHFRASHNDHKGYMMCCGRKFQQRKALAEHIYVHWNPEHFKCTTCNRVLQDARALEVHEQTHTNVADPKDKKMFQCDKCPKSFTTKAAFEYHSFSKHVPKSEFKFTCPECNKKLPTERKLKEHLKCSHDPESAIICDKCGKKMRSHSNLKKHHQIEHSEVPRPVPVPMQCDICGTWLRHLSGLKQHMKTIHDDSGREHRCHICNKTSTNSRALRRHIYHNHECERKFKCTMCEKAFKRKQDLREHTSTHTGEVLYTCPNCPMTFFSNANMYKHRQRLHKAEWESDRKKPRPPNIMRQATGATAAMKIQQAVGANSAFFAQKLASKFPVHTNVQ